MPMNLSESIDSWYSLDNAIVAKTSAATLESGILKTVTIADVI